MINLRAGSNTAQKTRELSQWDIAALEDMVKKSYSANDGSYHPVSLLALADKMRDIKHVRVSYVTPKTF